MELTQKNVAGVVTSAVEGVFTTSTSRGNVMVKFDGKLSSWSDEDKIRYLLTAADALRSQGIEPTVRLSTNFASRGEEANWRSYPHIWCNQPDPATQQAKSNASEVADLRAQLKQVMALLANQQPRTYHAEPEVIQRPSTKESASEELDELPF